MKWQRWGYIHPHPSTTLMTNVLQCQILSVNSKMCTPQVEDAYILTEDVGVQLPTERLSEYQYFTVQSLQTVANNQH